MANSKAPAFVKVNYHSIFGVHVGIVPTLAWNAGADQGEFATHNGSVCDANDMITALFTILAGILPDTASYDNYVIYDQPDPDDLPVPVATGALAIAGLDSSPGWHQATQVTMTFRTTNFGVFKLVTLDAATNDSFAKTTVVPGSGVLFNALAEVSNEDLGWAGQDNGRPNNLISQTVTLNEKLRRAYRLA
jgi:hypothetical protein